MKGLLIDFFTPSSTFIAGVPINNAGRKDFAKVQIKTHADKKNLGPFLVLFGERTVT